MFDIRKIQEQALFEAVQNHCDAETAGEIVYGKGDCSKAESNADWVNATMVLPPCCRNSIANAGDGFSTF